MSAPRSVKDSEQTEALWRRSVRDAINLMLRRAHQSGPTAGRPVNADIGTLYYDTTLGKPVWQSGAGWKDAGGNAA